MRKFLVVEDSVSARAFVRAVLEGFSSDLGGVEVVEASNGFDAMRLLPRGPYDLVITDINMSDINGLELIKFIRSSAHHKGTPLLVISTLRSDQDAARCLQLGANGYLAKPFSPAQLREACGKLLSADPVSDPAGDPSPEGPH